MPRKFGIPIRGLALALALGPTGQAVLADEASEAPARDTEQGTADKPASPMELPDLLQVRELASIQEAIPVAMRDGTLLSATIIVPNGASADSRLPVIMIQSPYAPANELGIPLEKAALIRLIREGYVVAIVNVRGTQWSEGEYHWMKGARQDGLDTLQWITEQPWSNGKVGVLGCSSSGEVTIPLAMANPPALKAVVAMAAATGVGEIPGFSDQGDFYMGGVPSFNWAWWYHGNGYIHHPKLPLGITQSERAALARAFESDPRYKGEDLSWAGHLPSRELLDAIGSPETEFNQLITLQPNSPEWKEYDFLRAGDKTTIPMLHMDSWYDTIEAYGTTRMYQYLSGNSPNQYLVMGGTSHCLLGTETGETMVGKRPVGDASFDYTSLVVQWFDHWLKDDGGSDLGIPKVRYYSIESSKWSVADDWPVPSTERRFYLSSGGTANSLSGDGKLVDDVPGSEPPDHFVDDPMHPVPTLGGGCCTDLVALDQSEIEKRADVLVYTTAPFEKSIDIAGYLSVTLYLSSSVPDGDIMVKLVDVYPDSTAYNITDTAQRLRYRDGIYKESLMTPGQIYQVTLGQMVMASHFATGHRLRIEVAGTNFPQYERNMHTGGRNFDETDPLVAHLSLYHDREHASFVQIPEIH